MQQLKAQISKKNEEIAKKSTASGGTSSTSASSNDAWVDNGSASSGGKFKFLHLIIVAIICLLLGYFLAKKPSIAVPEPA